MTQAQRTWLILTAWINLAAVAVVPLMLMAADPGFGWADLRQTWAYAFVYTNGVGVPAILLGRPLVESLVRRGTPEVAAVLAATLLFAGLGSLSIQALLMWTGVSVPRHFWPEYFHTLRAVVLLSIGVALGAFFHESLRGRLRQAEADLHRKEVARERERKLAAEARLRSLEARVHPHFLFNTLNTISALISVDPPRAERIVGRLAALLRSSLDLTSQPLIPLGQELALIEDYLEIESARLGDTLERSLDVPDELRGAEVPPLSIQSLVENAVKHGIAPQRGGRVQVTARPDGGGLRIEVADSGPGFDLAAVPPGHGLDNLVERLEALFGSRARLNVLQRPGQGVVEMVLPRS
jgi:sensor histidine kinase YesM